MKRSVLRVVLDVLVTIVVALGLLSLYLWLITDFSGSAIGEGARVLFLFMDVGLVIWLLLLVVFTIRWRARGGVSAGSTYVFLLVGTVLNAITVLVVGFVLGGAGLWLVLFAIQGGGACLLAAALVVPLVHRLLPSPAP